MSWKLVCGIATSLSVNLLASAGVADDSKTVDPAAAFAEAGKPAKAHLKLQPLAGEWTYTCRMWMAPGKPPIETKGTIERKWILGGRFLSEKVAGTGFDGKPGFEGFGLYGYDKSLKRYTSTFVCSMGTGTSTGLGVSNSDGTLTFKSECSCPLENKRMAGREVMRFESPDRMVVESYKTIEGGEVKVMQLVCVRKTK